MYVCTSYICVYTHLLKGSFLLILYFCLLTLLTVSEVSTQNFLALGNYFSLYFNVMLLFYFYGFPEINRSEITKPGDLSKAWAFGLQCLMESHTYSLAKVRYFCRLRTPQTSTALSKLFQRNRRM